MNVPAAHASHVLRPVTACAVPGKHALHTVWPVRFSNDHMLLPRRIQIALFGQVGHASEAPALFVYGGRLFDGSGQFDYWENGGVQILRFENYRFVPVN